jgi:cell division septum initiation protein DivIVA
MSTPAAAQAPSPATVATLLDQLRKHLESELAVQRKLLALAEQMAPKLMSGDAHGLSTVVAAEEEPTREAARLASVRQRLISALGAVFQLDGEVTLSRLLGRAPEAIRLELERLRTEITTVCQRLGRQAERNLIIARQGIALIRDVLGDAFGTRPVTAYDRRGLIGTGPPRRGAVLNIKG